MTIDVEAGDDEDQEDIDDLMAGITFSSAEKSYLFKRLGATGGSGRSSSMPNLYRILSNPSAYPSDAAVLKQIALRITKPINYTINWSIIHPDGSVNPYMVDPEIDDDQD